MSEQTPKLSLPYIMAAQAQKHVTHNEAIRALDALTQLTIVDRDLTSPPISPAEGACYIIAATATCAWASKETEIAAYQDGAWAYYPPIEGWTAWLQDEDELVVYDGSAWQSPGPKSLNPATGAMLGVNATADATNRLSVNSEAVLLNREVDDITLTLNKESGSDDASLTLKTAFSTRALLGLLGNDDLTLKVSPDGTVFHTGLTVDKDTGNVAIGTSSDVNNKLLVSGQNNLFTNAGPLNIVMNKGASGDDLSFTLQSNFSARALIGLLGNDDLTVKVTPDGSTYHDAIVIDKDNGAVSHPKSSKFSAYVNFDRYIPADSWSLIDNNNARHNNQGDWGAGIFTAPTEGYYLFGAGYRFKANGSVPSDIRVGLSINAATPTADRTSTSGDATIVTLQSSVQVTALLHLSAADTVRAMAYMTTNDGYVEADSNVFWGCRLP
ncbi:MAG: hypothetical protein DHS20C08_04800 [Rhodomicrobium sp.]|nr:MAG: hypothetical protein DHS20C08_04800 [Rhodomicrobium sp.]